MEGLAEDIRSFLIENISKTGGHLASNLGVVELTIALHFVFNCPKDRIFFDVGHQSYVHKILTGRAKDFPSLRHFKGMSGFQKRKESPYDVYEAGHSSTSLSAALGMAIARDLDGDNYEVVPVIGDGALSSGMSLEALNQIGSEQKKVIIIFNDNNMSISKNVGALSKGFSLLRTSKGYLNTKENTKSFLKQNKLGEVVYSGLKTMKDVLKFQVLDRGIFGEFNIDYIGPVNGHDLNELILAFEAAKLHDNGPIVVHVITKKGKGYAPCEKDKEGYWHGVGPFNIKTGKPLHDIPEGQDSWSHILSSSLCELAKDNKDIIAITPAMLTGSALQNFFAKYPDRSFDCGIAEEHAATFASGLAINGKRPYLSIYSSFLQRAYDQINHDICRMDLPVVIGIDHAGLVGEDGETHHGVFDIGLLTPIPNMILCQPADSKEAKDLLYTAFAQDHPFAIRYPKGITPILKGDVEKITVGSWIKGNDFKENRLYVLTYGEDYHRILDKVEKNALPITVVNCRFLKPLDSTILKEICLSKKSVITYEPDMLTGGLGSLIMEYCNKNELSISLERIGIGDVYLQQGPNRQLMKEAHMDLNTLFERIQKILEKENYD